MRHEPSRSCPSLQPITERGCAACWADKPLDEFPASAGRPAGCCVARRHHQVVVARDQQRRALRRVARSAAAGDHVLRTQHEGGDNAT